MSDHVIICGVRRARELVGAAELKQMLGRQGRQQNGLAYRSDVILNHDDFEVENTLSSKDSFEAKSTFNDVQNFCFHVLPEIANHRIVNRQGLQDFYDRSLAAYQEKKIDIDKVLSYLEEREAITRSQDTFSPAMNGMIAYQLYMHCGDVRDLRDNFKRIAEGDLESDGAIAWSLGNLETLKIRGDYRDHREEISRFRDELPFEYDCKEGCLITSSLWWCMMGNGVAGKQMANNVRQLKKQWKRMRPALNYCQGLSPQFIETLDLRITRNISKELVSFFSDEKMTKGRAMGLLSLGYSNAEGTENIELEYE